jgi:hypothetical protein
MTSTISVKVFLANLSKSNLAYSMVYYVSSPSPSSIRLVHVHNLLSETLGTRHVSEMRNFSDFGMVVRGITGQELSESIAQLISTDW